MRNFFEGAILALFCIEALIGADSRANAESSCTFKDFRPQLGAVRNQGDSAWCYAHTSADLISQKVGRRVSSFDIATTFLLADSRKLKDLKITSIDEYLTLHPEFNLRLTRERMRDNVYSPKKILRSQGLYSAGGVEDLAIFLTNTKGLCLEGNLSDENQNGTNYANDLLQIERFARGIPEADFQKLSRKMSYLTHIRSAESRVKAAAFQGWVDQKCRGRKRVRVDHVLTPGQMYIADTPDDLDDVPGPNRQERQELLQQTIDQQIDFNHAVAIGFDAYNLLPRDDGDTNKHADHSAIIAARQMRGSKCEYFVRFTYGDVCSSFLPEFKNSCEHGGVWVKFTDIPTLYSAVWIE